MRYCSFIIVLCIVSRAAADQAANGPNGVNARVTGLTGGAGYGVIAEVESDRPGKAGYDSASNSASNTAPNGVYFQTSGGQDAPNQHILDPQTNTPHATGVANIMIGQNGSLTGRTGVDYPAYEGVAQGAILVADASGDFDEVNLVESLNRMAIINGGGVEAINMSFIIGVSFPEGPDGSSYLSLFEDWSARQHDVLYINSWGNSIQSVDRAGPDTFNGIVVGASEQPGTAPNMENVWRKFSDVNATQGLGWNPTVESMHIDLLAPGKNMHVLETDDTAHTDYKGTSYSAPLTTGSVALLQEFVRMPHPTGNFTNATKHQVIKAAMMNSADKIAGVQGSYRTAIDSTNQTWLQSEAYGYGPIPLDDEMGTGLLNVNRATQQLAPGKFSPGPIPLIGWDYGVIPDAGNDIIYTFNQAFGAGDYLSVTLAWDRPVFCTCDTSYTTGSAFIANPVPDVDIIVETVGGVSIAASTSTGLTVEHIFTHVVTAGQYQIRLVRNFDSSESTNYGLAWWFGPPPGGIPGDYTNDGKVDGADYVVWRKDPASFGGAGGFDTWRTNYGTGAGSGASLASVPEPSSGMLLVVACIVMGAAKRSRV
jgi:hypothetical protein